MVMDETTTCCLFCYRKYSDNGQGNIENKSVELHLRFLRLLWFWRRGGVGEDWDWFDQLFQQCFKMGTTEVVRSCCEDCSRILTSFCELYHRKRCLELEMTWRLRKLAEVMTAAGKVKARVEQFQRSTSLTNGGVGRIEGVGRMRDVVLTKCKRLIRNSGPFVSLKRLREDVNAETSKTKRNKSTDEVGEVINVDTKMGDEATAIFHEDASNSEVLLSTTCEPVDCNSPPPLDEAELDFEGGVQSGDESLGATGRSAVDEVADEGDPFVSLLVTDENTEDVCPAQPEIEMKLAMIDNNDNGSPPDSVQEDDISTVHVADKDIREDKQAFPLDNDPVGLVKEHESQAPISRRLRSARTYVLPKVEQGIESDCEETDEERLSTYASSQSSTSSSSSDDSLVAEPDSDLSHASISSNDSKTGKRSADTNDIKKAKRNKPQRRQLRRKSLRKIPGETKNPCATMRFPYRCRKKGCFAKFSREEELSTHSQLHGEFPCNFCSVVETYAPDLALHELKDHVPKGLKRLTENGQPGTFHCPRCEYSAIIKSAFIRHHLQNHLSLTPVTAVCPLCSKAFFNLTRKVLNTLNGHIRKVHQTQEGKPLVQCDLCDAHFKNENLLVRHKRKIHDVRVRPHKCVNCDKRFFRIKDLRRHRRIVHDKQDSTFDFVCGVATCWKRFETKAEFERHAMVCRKSSGNLGNVCPSCGKVVDGGPASVFHHIRGCKNKERKKTSQSKTFICENCGKVCKTKDQLANHALSHSGPSSWQFECDVCKKRCMNIYKLEEHKRTHSKEKPFICSVCGEQYAHRHNWRNHMKTKHDTDLTNYRKGPTRKTESK